MTVDLTLLQGDLGKDDFIKANLHGDPIKQFERWLLAAEQEGVIEPNAMSLATTDSQSVSIRTVLLKYFDMEGFVFFTNYDSRKAKEIKENSQVALLFPWLQMERQVKISGIAEKVSTEESSVYFSSRPKYSQLGAWASQQSSHLSSRQMLLERFDELKNRYKDEAVPLPNFWGGYRVVPHRIEFWQGRDDRLHDRFQYQKLGDEWLISRLAP